mmetsp:Transcript_26341/g.53548  ORF Transcript_26341/g.53548 Transcript_26341/m.53548 type:complete len:242 (+) Transcript_26341:300-1025(+)
MPVAVGQQDLHADCRVVLRVLDAPYVVAACLLVEACGALDEVVAVLPQRARQTHAARPKLHPLAAVPLVRRVVPALPQVPRRRRRIRLVASPRLVWQHRRAEIHHLVTPALSRSGKVLVLGRQRGCVVDDRTVTYSGEVIAALPLDRSIPAPVRGRDVTLLLRKRALAPLPAQELICVGVDHVVPPRVLEHGQREHGARGVHGLGRLLGHHEFVIEQSLLEMAAGEGVRLARPQYARHKVL